MKIRELLPINGRNSLQCQIILYLTIHAMWMQSVYKNTSVILNDNIHAVLHVFKEFVPEGINDRHPDIIQPYIRKDCTCRGERIDRL